MSQPSFKATKSRSQGREGWCAIFRHPLKPTADGSFARVRRGLGTPDVAEADRLLAELNKLLGDKAYWTPAARDRAGRELDARVVKIFFDGLVPASNDPWAMREEFMPLPTAAQGYARVLFLGPTGAGKTTLLRQLIGSDPRTDRFPSTSKSKTTTADMEIVLADGKFEAVVTFLSLERTRTYVDECVTAAVSLAAEGADESRVLGALLEHEEQRFRLSFILGTLATAPDAEQDEWDATDEPGDDGSVAESAEIEPKARAEMEARLRRFLDGVLEIGERVRVELETDLGESVAKLKSGDLDAFLQLVEDRVRDDENTQLLIDEIMDEIRARFQYLDPAPEETSDAAWPIRWTIASDDRAQFIRAINRLTSNYAPNFGRLLTPLVTGIRVRGPFMPTWMKDEARPRVVLLDGEGLGHTPDSAASLPTHVTKLFHTVDVILLVDNAEQPMLSGPSAVLRSVTAAGHDSKLTLVFTHFDQMEADNLRGTRAKQDHVLRSVDNALAAIEAGLGSATTRGVRRHLQDRVFFAGNLQEHLGTNPPGAKFTRGQLAKLLELVERSITPPEPLTATPTYDTANLVLCIKAAVDRFHNKWEGLLGVTFRPGYRPEHWTRIKALSRRFAEMDRDYYGTLMPVADLLREMTEGLANFVATPRAWSPVDASDSERQDVIERVRRALSTRLQELATSRIKVEPLASWQEAYRRSGSGSGTERSRDLWRIYLVGAPVLRETPAREANEFVDRMRQLFREAVEEVGGTVL
jgi:hypothetical protein